MVQVCPVKGVITDLAGYELAFQEPQLFDYLSASGAFPDVLRPDLPLRVAVVCILGEYNPHPGLAGERQETPYRRYGPLRVGYQELAALLEEVVLHGHDDERRAGRLHLDLVVHLLLRGFDRAGHINPPLDSARESEFTLPQALYDRIMGGEEERPKRLRDDPLTREELRERLARYLDVPLALASVAMVLCLGSHGAAHHRPAERRGGRTLERKAGGPELDALGVILRRVREQVRPGAGETPLSERTLAGRLVMLLPFLRLLRVLRILRATRALPVFRRLIFGGKGSSDALVLLRRRRLGQLAAASAMVVLIGRRRFSDGIRSLVA